MQPSYPSVPVWDGPVRLFHWSIVLLVFMSWLTERERWMSAHMISGYAMFAALLFRLVWGFIGSETARFGHFLDTPFAALRHLRGFARSEPDHGIGHNAAGGWMVLVMLLALAVQVGSGLCANDEISIQGPLAEQVGPEWSDWLTHVHAVTFTAIEVTILLHVAAVLAYFLLKRHNLVGPMITGRKPLPPSMPPPRMRSPALAAAILLVAGGVVTFVVLRQGGAARHFPLNRLWQVSHASPNTCTCAANAASSPDLATCSSLAACCTRFCAAFSNPARSVQIAGRALVLSPWSDPGGNICMN